MIDKLDTSHAFDDKPQICGYRAHLGVGGTGRDAARAGYRAEELIFGKPSPHTVLGEFDLCDETGRGLEQAFVPELSGVFSSVIMPGTNCAAIVERHKDDPAYALWRYIDPTQIDVENTHILGGYANPQVARAVEEFYASIVDEWVRDFTQNIKTACRTSVPGWEPRGPFVLNVYASPNGSVGHTALNLISKIAPMLTPGFRIVHTWLLLADHGRVTDRRVARALQHAALTEVHVRTRGAH